MTLPFDAIASQFDDQRGLPADALRRLAEFVGQVSPGESLRIIEPGIGTGRISLPLAAAGHSVTGIDISRQMLNACASRAEALRVSSRVRLLHGDAIELACDDDVFDVGIVASLLYLVTHWEGVLDELARVVRPGGAIIQVRERTTSNKSLQRWDSAWRTRIEAVGGTHASLSPTDAAVEDEMRRRWPDVSITSLASWGFGQTVSSARDGYRERLRALYPTVGDLAWEASVSQFLEWADHAFPDPDTHLGGEVNLELVTAGT